MFTKNLALPYGMIKWGTQEGRPHPPCVRHWNAMPTHVSPRTCEGVMGVWGESKECMVWFQNLLNITGCHGTNFQDQGQQSDAGARGRQQPFRTPLKSIP